MFTGKDNITAKELGELAHEINSKKFKRPISEDDVKAIRMIKKQLLKN